MKKIIRLGTIKPAYTQRAIDVFCKIEIKDGRLSISGVEGPLKNGDALGSCGQIDGHLKPAEITPAPGWTRKLITEFLRVWDKWHLNDMRANCEHQTGAEWDTTKKIILQKYTWSDKFHKMRGEAQAGTMPAELYAEWQDITRRVHATTIGINSPKYETPEVKQLLANGYIKPDKTEEKTAGWIRPEEHPDGLLTKPCPTCGYKYGSEWRKEELPADVVAFLESLPTTDKTPAWV